MLKNWEKSRDTTKKNVYPYILMFVKNGKVANNAQRKVFTH